MPSTTKRGGAMLAIMVAAATAPAVAQPGELKPDVQWGFASDAVHPGDVLHAALQVTIPEGFHVQSDKPLDEFLVPTALTLTPPQGTTVPELVYPKPIMFKVQGFDGLQAVFDHKFIIGVALQVGSDVNPGVYLVAGELHYQACDDKICLQPATLTLTFELKVLAPDVPIRILDSPLLKGIPFSANPVPNGAPPPPRNGTPIVPPANFDCDVVTELDGFTVLGTTGGYLGAEDFIAFIEGAETGTIERSPLEGKGPLAIVLLVILGGVLLNLTPCVLPLIPINLAIIGAGAQAGSRARGFALGGTYGLAMAIVYGALGLIVTLTAATFGEINSTIWFNVAIAILFVALALAMFDVIAIDFTKYQSKFDATGIGKSGTFALAFAMGAVSALLAGACVAPVVIQVIVYAGAQYAKGSTIALALPFFLGLGMALPWPFAGAGLALLPKPGKWMVRVKQAMGVFILAFAAYYGYLAWEIWDSRRIDPALVSSAVKEQLEGGWTPSICQGLASARAENKLVLIDMWATWCKNCFAMDRTTFKDDQVLARLDDYVKIKFQAEKLSESPVREIIQRVQGKSIGLPFYAILRPKRADGASTHEAPVR